MSDDERRAPEGVSDREIDAVRAHLAQLRAHVDAGGGLDNGNARWLLNHVEGGFWGRACAALSAKAKRRGLALRAVIEALVTGAGAHWTGAHWRPVLAILREADDLPPLDTRGLDVGFCRHEDGVAVTIEDLRIVQVPEWGEPPRAVTLWTQEGDHVVLRAQRRENAGPGFRVAEPGEFRDP